MLSVRETTEAGHAGPTRPTTLGQGEKGPSVGAEEEQSEGSCLPLSLQLYTFSLSFLPAFEGRRRSIACPAPSNERRHGRVASLLFPPSALPTVATGWEEAKAPHLSRQRCRGQSRGRIIMKRNLASSSPAPKPRSPAKNGGGGARGPGCEGAGPRDKLKKISSMVRKKEIKNFTDSFAMGET